MADTSTGDPGKPMKKPSDNLSEAIKQPSVATSKISSSSKNLSDMPIDIVGMIIERSDYKRQLILRKVSKSFRALVDKHKPALMSLKVCCKQEFIICKYNFHVVVYISPDWIFSEPLSHITFHFDSVITKDDYEKVAFDDLALNLKNPKLKLEEFSFDSKVYDDKEKYKTMENILKSRNHQLSVKTCAINIPNPSNALSILPYLKPGVLEKITILRDKNSPGWIHSRETMQKVALLEQWKQAEHLELRSGFPEFLIQHVTHFKRFEIYEKILRLDRLIEIRNCILEHKNPQFCSIWPRFFDFPTFGRTDLSQYTIPDSEYYVEVMTSCGHVTIKKKKK